MHALHPILTYRENIYNTVGTHVVNFKLIAASFSDYFIVHVCINKIASDLIYSQHEAIQKIT